MPYEEPDYCAACDRATDPAEMFGDCCVFCVVAFLQDGGYERDAKVLALEYALDVYPEQSREGESEPAHVALSRIWSPPPLPESVVEYARDTRPAGRLPRARI